MGVEAHSPACALDCALGSFQFGHSLPFALWVRPSPLRPSSGDRPIAPLTSKQRAFLRSLAHPLKPILQVGAEGVSDAFVRSLEEAFRTRELLKIKVLDTAPHEAKEVADELPERLPRAHVAQVIGRTVVVYRAFPEKPEINLPK